MFFFFLPGIVAQAFLLDLPGPLDAELSLLQFNAEVMSSKDVAPSPASTMQASMVTRANHHSCPFGITDEGVAATVQTMAEANCSLDEERIQVLTRPRPRAWFGQAVIRVAYSSVNPVNWKVLLNNPFSVAYPQPMGLDFAGTVESVGLGCDLSPGDEVWGVGQGTYAEYAAVDCPATGRKPAGLSMKEAGVLPLVALTGLEGLQWAGAPWASGPTVVVLGGSGGTGSAGVQLAKALGASKVITTASPSNFEFVRDLGADEVIDYHTANWWEVIPARSVDLVYDCVCLAGTGDNAYRVLKDGGSFVTIQSTPLANATTRASRPSVSQHSYILSKRDRGQLDILRSFAEARQLTAAIDSVFGLKSIPEAFGASMTSHTVGKIAIDTQA